MNYVILIGIALFFILTAVRDGEMGWNFNRNSMNFRIGDADYLYTRNSSTSQHSVIELTLDAALFGGGTIESVFWRPSCGNDELNVDVDHQIVPEASTLVSWGLLVITAALGLVWHKRRTTLAMVS